MPRTKLDRNYVCQAANRELRKVDKSKSRILGELGIAESTYYTAIDTGTLRLEMFARIAKNAGLTDEQILKIVRARD